MSWIQRRVIPLTIIAVCAILTIVDYFVKVPAINAAASEIGGWAVIISAFAIGLGTMYLVISQVRCIVRRDKGRWPFSIILLVSMGIYVLTGLLGKSPGTDPYFMWIYSNVQVPVNISMTALLAPFIASAAYRAFRVRSLEAGLMLIAGVLVMLKNAPIGTAIWSGFGPVGGWVYDVPSMAASRGILIGVGVGTLALGLRTILGYERGALGE